MKSNFKKSVNIVLVLAFTFFIGTIAQAQPGQGGQGGQGGQQGPPAMPTAKQITKMVDDVAKELALSTEQKTKVSALYVAHFKEASEIVSSKSARDAQRTAMDKLKTSFEKQVKAELTEAQQKKFVAYQKKNEPKQGGGPQRQ